MNHALKMKAAYVDWASNWKWERMVAITLTCKRTTLKDADQLCMLLRKNLGRFINIICGAIKVKRKNLQVLAVIEGGLDNPHIHLIVDLPKRIALDTLERLVRVEWPVTEWGHKETKVVECWDNGFIDYCFKLTSKRDFGDFCFDEKNTNCLSGN